MISCRNVCVEYRLDETNILSALRNVSFDVNESEFVAVIGPNGSGKSTLALCLSGLLQPTSGEIFIDNSPIEVPLLGIDSRAIHTIVGIVFQNPDDQIIASSVEREIAFALENRGIPREEMKCRVNDIINRFSLDNMRERQPDCLSGGQKQKLAIASVLVSNPKFLILDEPTSFLDDSDRRMLIQLLNSEFQKPARTGFTVLLITQFSREAARCGRVVVMNRGEIIADGTPEYVFIERQEELLSIGVEVPVEYRIKKVYPGFDCTMDGYSFFSRNKTVQ